LVIALRADGQPSRLGPIKLRTPSRKLMVRCFGISLVSLMYSASIQGHHMVGTQAVRQGVADEDYTAAVRRELLDQVGATFRIQGVQIVERFVQQHEPCLLRPHPKKDQGQCLALSAG
jgi:hypothetical protein